MVLYLLHTNLLFLGKSQWHISLITSIRTSYFHYLLSQYGHIRLVTICINNMSEQQYTLSCFYSCVYTLAAKSCTFQECFNEKQMQSVCFPGPYKTENQNTRMSVIS